MKSIPGVGFLSSLDFILPFLEIGILGIFFLVCGILFLFPQKNTEKITGVQQKGRSVGLSLSLNCF